MGKKYLDTKQDTIEAAVLDVWVDAAEEQKAIQSAARMVVDDTIAEAPTIRHGNWTGTAACLLYTSDAADE